MKETLSHLEKLADAISDAEYRFLFLEPILLYGIAVGLIGFIATYFMKAEKMQIAALIVIAASSLAFVPYIKARTEAQPRIEKIYKVSEPSRAKGFVDNTWTWKQNKWIYFAAAGVAVATVLVGARRNRLGLALGIATISFGLLAMKNSAWMHYKDALAYHPNLKSNESAPVNQKLKKKSERESKPVAKSAEPEARTPRVVTPLSSN